MIKEALTILAIFYLPAIILWRAAYYTNHARFIQISKISFYIYTLATALYFAPFILQCHGNFIYGFEECFALSGHLAYNLNLGGVTLGAFMVCAYVLVLAFYGAMLIYKKVSKHS